MARLTFNSSAAREYFESDRLNWLRLRIERGVITLRPAANARGDDEVIRIERRPRGIVAEVDEGRFSKRLMTRLFRAGLTEDQPYFLLAPASYGWIGIDHLPGMKPPQRQAIMVVSNFETQEAAPQPMRVPANAFDIAEWQRFLRAIKTDKAIEDTGWADIRQMILLAHQITSQRQRGRQSHARIAATRLLGAVQRRMSSLLEWEERHPELRREVSMVLRDIGFEIEEAAADVIHIHTRRRGRPPRIEPVTVADDVAPEPKEVDPEPAVPWQPEAEPEDLPPPPRRASRRRRQREPVQPIEPEVPVEADPPAEAEINAADEQLQRQFADDMFPDEVAAVEPETVVPVADEQEPILDEGVADTGEPEEVEAEASEIEDGEIEVEEGKEHTDEAEVSAEESGSAESVEEPPPMPDEAEAIATEAESPPVEDQEGVDHREEPEASAPPESHEEQRPGEGEQPEIGNPHHYVDTD